MRPKKTGKGYDYEFRAVTTEDLERERIVEEYVAEHLAEWQANGWVPDMRIEPGDKTDEPIRDARLDPLAPPVQPAATAAGGTDQPGCSDARLKFGLTQVLNRELAPKSIGQ